jgi:PhnB protein
MTDVKPIPGGTPRVTPSLTFDGDGCGAAIDFYTEVLGATERLRVPAPGGKVGHAELQLGDSLINVSDEAPERGYRGPQAVAGDAGAAEHREAEGAAELDKDVTGA